MLLYYKEARDGQILEEGVNSAGALASWLAAATSYSCHQVPMIPIYFFYSMFGFQRLGDLIWAAAAMRARGFLVGAVAGRTSLAGEGIQHQDGHSPLWASAVPSCIAYDPAYAYELAVIVEDGLRRMIGKGEDVFYYLTTYNESYEMPAMPEGSREGILRGMYLLRPFGEARGPRVRLLGSGTILGELIAAADLLAGRFGIASEVWSVTSYSELRRDGLRAERHNRLHPEAPSVVPWVTARLTPGGGPVVAVSDYMRTVADQIRAFVPARFVTMGTDGYGRSDAREALRRYFEIDQDQIAVAAVKALADDGVLTPGEVAEAIRQLGIDPDAADPAGA
jgi:pyruvate dehydrogenase E1 component